jgi:hypothetical protein
LFKLQINSLILLPPFKLYYVIVIVLVTPLKTYFKPVVVLDSSQTSPSLGVVGAGPTLSLISADNVVDAAICKLAVGLGILIYLTSCLRSKLKLSVVVAYVPEPKKHHLN